MNSKFCKRPDCVINELPENNFIKMTKRKTIPGNSTYANLAEKGKKICMIGDSISKKIDMVEFSKYADNGHAIKRSFPGATASHLKYYALPTLFEETPDTVILQVGTNNITKKHQRREKPLKKLLKSYKHVTSVELITFLCPA